MVSSGPEVSVIVPHFDDLERLDLCLTQLSRQDFPMGRFEIIVADNGSPQGPEAVMRVIAGRARLAIVTERGAGAARNGGVLASTGRVLAFTDSDCQPEVSWLTQGVAALTLSDVVGGRMTVLVQNPRHMTPAEAFECVFAFDNEAYVRRKGFTVSANLFCARSVFDDVGGFATSVVSEDVEWCLRATAKGYRLGYAPLCVVGHPARRTWSELLKKTRRINAETYGLMRLRGKGKAAWVLRSFAMPFTAIVMTPKALFDRRLRTLGQRIGALEVLYGLRLWRSVDSLRLLATTGRMVKGNGS